MQRITALWILVLALCGFGHSSLAAEAGADAKAEAGEKPADTKRDAKASETASAERPASAHRPVLYRPPKVGKPAESVGGGTRGRSDVDPVLYALVPDHVGQTSSDQPALFWFVDRKLASPVRVEFTLIADGEIEPVVESEIPVPIEAGIHRVRLSEHGVKLEPGVEYEWSIAIVLDSDEPAKDVVATGWIERVQPSDLAGRLAAGGEEEAPYVYADQGLWYDALTAVDQRIGGGDAGSSWISVRSDLLKQVGLGVAAGG